MHDVCVIGLGTIGLPLAALLAHRGGFSVLGAEIDPQRRTWVLNGAPDSVEPGLSEVVQACVGKTLTVGAQPEPAPATVICVPTPVQGHQPDLTAMWAAVKAVERLCPCLLYTSPSPRD